MASRVIKFYDVCTEDHPISAYQQFFEREMLSGKEWVDICGKLKLKMCCRTAIHQPTLLQVDDKNRDMFIDDTSLIPVRQNGNDILPLRDVPEFPIF